MVRSDPGAAQNPQDVDWTHQVEDAVVPGTVASTLLGSYDPSRLPDINYDDYDWWYESEFAHDDAGRVPALLRFEGLATIAEVWLNGESLLQSRNMFRSFAIDVSDRLKKSNKLCIVFRSVNTELAIKRPRGKWKTNLVSHQQLRWIRTTLLGRIPGWTPPVQPVGPWRGITLETGHRFSVTRSSVRTETRGKTGSVLVEIELDQVDKNVDIEDARIEILGNAFPLTVSAIGEKGQISGSVDVGEVELWWPNQYGDPVLHDYTIRANVGDTDTELATGRVGFREVVLDREDGRLAFVVNGQEIFARGACWSTNDIVSLNGDDEKLQRVLRLTKEAGANMIRVGGTMVYEADRFYDLCDEFGLMIWQDFMFANMDYPSADEEFLADVKEEIQGQIHRLRQHPCLIAWCGNSEVEQQAAMFGMTEDVWKNDLFYSTIPEAIGELHPETPYFPSSPCEGALPFHNSKGPSHYFGVGAYKQNFDDLHKSDVKFATECLAFSNMPSDEHLKRHFGTTAPAVHTPKWKAGVPRDNAAGWDFEDIRDFYIKKLYGEDPIELRYYDKERYVRLSQRITGEVMQATYDSWQNERSNCAGALVWFLNDIVPGAGWGLIDCDGLPKPAYFSCRRAWSAICLSFVDRGMDGLEISVGNSSTTDDQYQLVLQLIGKHGKAAQEFVNELPIASGHTMSFNVDSILGRFIDPMHRYRFGPKAYETMVATLLNSEREVVARTRHVSSKRTCSDTHYEVDLSLRVSTHDDQTTIFVSCDKYLSNVRFNSNDLEFLDNFVDICPNIEQRIEVRQITDRQKTRVRLDSVSLVNDVSVTLILRTAS